MSNGMAELPTYSARKNERKSHVLLVLTCTLYYNATRYYEIYKVKYKLELIKLLNMNHEEVMLYIYDNYKRE